MLEEKERRLKQRKDAYGPNAGQKQVHVSPAKERFVFSGNGSGKTCLLVQEMLAAANGYNPWLDKYTKVPAKIICVIDAPDKIAKQMLPEMKKWTTLKEDQLHKQGKPFYERISFPNGSEITFMSHDQAELKFEGIELDYLFADEPMPRHIYIGLSRGMRTEGSEPRTLCVGTPLAQPWFRKDIYEPWAKGELPDVECFKYESKVNEQNLAKGWLESFAAKLSEKERETRLKGEFFDLDGMALSHLFTREEHLVDPFPWPNGWPTVVSIDPHGSKAHFACLVGIDPDGKLFYLKEMKAACAPRDFALQLKEFYQGYRVVDIICDSYGNGNSFHGETFIAGLRHCNVPVRATRYDDKKDEQWINRIQDVLRLDENEVDNMGQRKPPQLRIVRTCHGIISDIESVQWQKIKNHDDYKPTLDIGNKDYLACLKYALAANLTFMKGRERIVRPRSPVSITRRSKWRSA